MFIPVNKHKRHTTFVYPTPSPSSGNAPRPTANPSILPTTYTDGNGNIITTTLTLSLNTPVVGVPGTIGDGAPTLFPQPTQDPSATSIILSSTTSSSTLAILPPVPTNGPTPGSGTDPSLPPPNGDSPPFGNSALAIGLPFGILALLSMLVGLWYCKRRRTEHSELRQGIARPEMSGGGMMNMAAGNAGNFAAAGHGATTAPAPATVAAGAIAAGAGGAALSRATAPTTTTNPLSATHPQALVIPSISGPQRDLASGSGTVPNVNDASSSAIPPSVDPLSRDLNMHMNATSQIPATTTPNPIPGLLGAGVAAPLGLGVLLADTSVASDTDSGSSFSTLPISHFPATLDDDYPVKTLERKVEVTKHASPIPSERAVVFGAAAGADEDAFDDTMEYGLESVEEDPMEYALDQEAGFAHGEEVLHGSDIINPFEEKDYYQNLEAEPIDVDDTEMGSHLQFSSPHLTPITPVSAPPSVEQNLSDSHHDYDTATVPIGFASMPIQRDNGETKKEGSDEDTRERDLSQQGEDHTHSSDIVSDSDGDTFSNSVHEPVAGVNTVSKADDASPQTTATEPPRSVSPKPFYPAAPTLPPSLDLDSYTPPRPSSHIATTFFTSSHASHLSLVPGDLLFLQPISDTDGQVSRDWMLAQNLNGKRGLVPVRCVRGIRNGPTRRVVGGRLWTKRWSGSSAESVESIGSGSAVSGASGGKKGG
ncbi:hypothetical protein BC832DRAFT_591129 [Gaertneriomyces semiglobifer]|nr:hypothetical protein BC832DRAFT_591129 [Gaertneriomyces semiglobifer]